MTVSVDFETRSAVDLRRTGVYKYAQDKTTDVWCMSYAFDDQEPRVWRPTDDLDEEFVQYITQKGELRAWNANFERVIWNEILAKKYGWPKTAIEQWVCTAAEARAMALPGSLDLAAQVLGVQEQKDKEGSNLMLRMAKPRRVEPDGTITWWDVPERVLRLIQYCKQDVRTEVAIAQAIRRLTPLEQKVFWLDQTINDRGVALDAKLAKAAKKLATKAVLEANRAVYDLTHGKVAKVTNVARLTDWLKEQGLQVDSLGKDSLRELQTLSEGKVSEVLALRADAGKSSVAKVDSMLEAVCRDGRIRGLLLYHGAATGRWAGRLVQPQNFPRGNVNEAEQYIDQVLNGEYEALDAVHPIMEIVSALLRAMLVASPDKKLLAADFAAIEARVLAWLAGEELLLETFRTGGDVYKVMASKIYSVSADEVDKVQRQVGKMCFAAETRVLTNRGIVRIIDIKDTDLLWDGLKWVQHQGLIYQGTKATITHFGLTATPDHEILTELGWREWKEVSTNRSLLMSALSSATLPSWNGVGTSPLAAETSGFSQFVDAIVAGWGSFVETIYRLAGQRGVTIAPKSRQVRSAIGNTNKPCPTTRTELDCSIDCRQLSGDVITQITANTSITASAEFPFNNLGNKLEMNFFDTFKRYQVGMTQIWKWIEQTSMAITVKGIFALFLDLKIWLTNVGSKIWRRELDNSNPNLRHVFDIANAGDLHRFTVITDNGPLIVHNCILGLGYGMGAKKFIDSCKAQAGIELTEEQAKAVVQLYRATNTNIVKLWAKLNSAALEAVRVPGSVQEVGQIKYTQRGGYLWCILPSKRPLAYARPRIVERETPWGSTNEAVSFEGMNSMTRKWERHDLYGGLLAENVTQAVARDIMAEAMLRLEEAGYSVIMSVHDELVAEVPEDFGSVAQFVSLMSEVPIWAEGCPVDAEGYESKRYRK